MAQPTSKRIVTEAALAANNAARDVVQSATFAKPRPDTLVVIGDSITEQGGLRPTVEQYVFDKSFWSWGQSLTKNRLKLLANAGVGGNTTAQILARLQSEALSLNPGWVHVLAGTNDVGLEVPLATTQANLTAIWDACLAANVYVLAGTIPPRDDAPILNARIATLNAWIKAQGRERKNFTLIDYYAALIDPVTSGFVSGYASDGVHLSSVGAYQAGLQYARAVSVLVPPADNLVSSPADPANMLGADGRNVGGGEWFTNLFAVAPTVTRPARTDGISGAWTQLVVPTGDKAYLGRNVNLGAGLSVGDTISARIEYEVESLDAAAAAGTRALTVFVQCYNGSGFPVAGQSFWFSFNEGIDPNMPAASRAGVATVPPVVIPTGTTLVQINVAMRGGGTYRFDRADIIKS